MPIPEPPSLYDPTSHFAACGLGFVARIDGQPSQEIVDQGLLALANLGHRGAAGADAETGDGAGILVQLPHSFLRVAARKAGFELPDPGWYGAGSCFVWSDPDQAARCEDLLAMIATEEGQRVIGWRDVPHDLSAIGAIARRVAPRIRQVFIERRSGDRAAFERKLYLIRRRFHRTVERAFGSDRFYVVSLSSRTMVYKGLLQGSQVRAFYPDLSHPNFVSALALVHSRFSTNTAESWALAHPYRYIAHNGEINTLRGNLSWMRARQAQLASELFGSDIPKLDPIIEPMVSDSAAFDNALEFLHLGGRSLPQAIMTMVPEAWENNAALDEDRRAFYHYSSALMQPWDGPAAIAFTNGRLIGAVLDRNGLRPARYERTRDGRLIVASEDGVLPLGPEDIVERGRLGPGQMIACDLEKGEVSLDEALKQEVVDGHPYRRWVQENTLTLEDAAAWGKPETVDVPDVFEAQRAFGYTFEELRLVLAPMAKSAQEPDGSMGTDTPLAVLSSRPRLLFDHLHQLFAQVTNPPIDPLREKLVMSLRATLGRQHNLLVDGPHHARRIVLPTPVMRDAELARLRDLKDASYRTVVISLLWPVVEQEDGLAWAIDRICAEAASAVRHGASILVLSDRNVSSRQAAIPILLATGAVHAHLVEHGMGGDTTIVAETAEAREVHHVAALLAFGADAVNPYLAFRTVADLAGNEFLVSVSPEKAQDNYLQALNKGLLKVISKMGISTLHSYGGSTLFEIVGLSRDVTDRFFPGAPSRIGGLTLEGIAKVTLQRHAEAYVPTDGKSQALDPGGDYQLRAQGEAHAWNEKVIPLLQRSVRNQDFATFEDFARHADGDSRGRYTLRSLLDLSLNPIPLEEVEPASNIVRRFNTGAMSLGSISRETHEALAVAMNRLAGRSNSGEGGEDSARFLPRPDGESARSAIKQVASARFGVTANYLVNADMLQIKIAQGAKPGEGGQLPGHKVSDEIARLRHSVPGVGLISPPPHHDIYSIEDLAQLIFDLRMVAPSAKISVKLVAEAGVGTIAAGVAKAKADHITIAGYDGGTGAAMLSSIKRAGLPWELGLAETQQVLVDNDLRSRVRLQVDGQLRTGRDVVVGALLGAEEFGFSTAPLVAMGCVMMRVCHLNTCPVGIATQDPVLRARFRGQPENVVNYMFFVAESVRRLMAELGFRHLDDMVGRVDLLHPLAELESWKARSLDLQPILRPPPKSVALHCIEGQVENVSSSFDARVLPQLRPALEVGQSVALELPVANTDRTVGGMISGEIARRYGEEGLPHGTISLHLNGVGGQSFGAWGARGLLLDLEGAVNDYAGKGLSGATLIVRPPSPRGYDATNSVIVGNVALYGATSGEAYFAGRAGERFAVRNSGATAVVEGCGDHGCEYMTGGTVMVLGPTGRNFAAGMSGGLAFVYDEFDDFSFHCNLDMVTVEPLPDSEVDRVHGLLSRHAQLTASDRARDILAAWPQSRSFFVRVLPNDLARVLAERLGTAQTEKESV